MSNLRTGRAARRDLTSGSLGWNLFRLAAPLAATQFLHALYNLADAFWLGHWSKNALAAQAVCWPFFFIIFALAFSFGGAGTALVAQYAGADRHREADRAAAQTMLLLVVMSTALGIPMAIFSRSLLRLVQVPPTAIGTADVYLKIFLMAVPLIGFSVAYTSILRALGDTVTALVIGLIANVLNIVMDPLLIYGIGFFPTLGAGGAAAASLGARVVEGLLFYALLRRGHLGVHLRLRDLKPHWPVLSRMVRVGVPLAVNRSSDSVGFAVFQTMINTLGTTVIGAFTVGFRIIHFFNLPAHAMAMAAAPIVGQALGAGKPDLARRSVRWSAGIVAGVMFLPLILLLTYGKLVARLFVDDPGVIQEAGRFFMVVPASSYLFGVLMVLLAAFYGSGHTVPAMVVGFVRLWVIRLPLAYFLAFVLGWNSLGIYLGMVGGNVVCAAITFGLFKTKGWQSAVVETDAPVLEEKTPREAPEPGPAEEDAAGS
ncbi:MAG: MATE family efflux transporter [Candidatus Brocadiia bacterium]